MDILLAVALMVGQIGQLMGPAEGASAPGGGFAITTEAGDAITTESSSILVTENAP